MENWGLIICPNRDLLLSEEKNAFDSENIALVVAHEIAHQWFGNLVTPRWWDDIWLSEGISSYMEVLATSAYFPMWYKIDKLLIDSTSETYILCTTKTEIETISKNISTMEELKKEKFFNFLETYIMGAVITHMTQTIVGNKTFWNGVKIYLSENAYGNVEEKDFWNSLTKAQPPLANPKINMRERMTSWTHLLGKPIVFVKRNYQTQTAVVSQVSCRENASEEHKNDLWHIPISYNTINYRDWNSRITQWMSTRNATFKYMAIKNEWLLVNGQGFYNYIVNYDTENWKLLSKQLDEDHSIFPINVRYKLLSDAALLFRFNIIGVTTILDLYQYLFYEDEITILQPLIIEIFNIISTRMDSSINIGLWQEFLHYTLGHFYDEIGFEENYENDLANVREIREEFLPLLCRYDYPKCIKDVKIRYQEWKESYYNETRYDEWVYCVAIQHGTDEDWEQLYNLIITKHLQLLATLACTNNKALVNRLLNRFMDENSFNDYFPVRLRILLSKDLWMEFFRDLERNFEYYLNSEGYYNHLMFFGKRIQENEIKFNEFERIINKHFNELSEEQAESFNKLKNNYKENEEKRKSFYLEINRWLNRKSWQSTKMNF